MCKHKLPCSQDVYCGGSKTLHLCCTGERIFDWFTPAAMYKHKLPFTVCFTAAMFIIFFYCAAEFPVFFTQFASFNPAWSDDVAKAQACYATSTSLYYGPGQLQHWIKTGVMPYPPCLHCADGMTPCAPEDAAKAQVLSSLQHISILRAWLVSALSWSRGKADEFCVLELPICSGTSRGL